MYDVFGYFDEAKHASLIKWLSEASEQEFIKGSIIPKLMKGFFTNLLRRGALLSNEVFNFIFLKFFPP